MTPADLMGAFAAMFSDPHAPLLAHLRAQMRAASEAETRAAERRMRRAMLGSCECGEVAGEALCPWCDLGLTKTPADHALDEQRRAERRDAIAKAMAELRPGPVVQSPGAPRPPNRHERRRARSRRWRG